MPRRVDTGREALAPGNSTAAAIVTMSIVGYSTQVTDAGISTADGDAGQALTINSTGTGAYWVNPGAPVSYTTTSANSLPVSGTTVGDSIPLPANVNFELQWTGEATTTSSVSDTVNCEIDAWAGTPYAYSVANTSVTLMPGQHSAPLAMQTVQTGLTYGLVCSSTSGLASISSGTLTATQLSNATQY